MGVSGAPDSGANGGENTAGASLDDLLSKIDMSRSDEGNEITEMGELDQKETDGYTEAMNMKGELQTGDKAPEAPSLRDNRDIEEKEKNVGKYNPKDLASAISTMLRK
jgi:hypothetical protein